MSSTVATTLWHLGATELAELIRTGQASCLEVVEAHLRRIEEVNPRLNAVVLVLPDKVFVTGMKGPLEEGWQDKVEAFAARIPLHHAPPGADHGLSSPGAGAADL